MTAERVRAARLEQEAEAAVCHGCEHAAHGGGPCDAWWIVPGTADVEVSCGCQGDEEDEPADGAPPGEDPGTVSDPWVQHNLRAGDCEDVRARTVFPALRESCPACHPAPPPF